ncbi:MAG: iron ABC transporter permease [Alphaproteobacteria bacterium]|nr:iron ABC transporter permease [Alphaproteobacteria bacterium]
MSILKPGAAAPEAGRRAGAIPAGRTGLALPPLLIRMLEKIRRGDATGIVWILTAVLLLLLIVNPAFFLVKESLFVPDEVGLLEVKGHYGIGNFVEAYTNRLYLSPILWTIIISASVGIISVVVGSLMAWAVARTDMPFPSLIRTASLLSFVTPPFLGASAWVILAGPREGWLNNFYRWVTGAGPEAHLFDIFTMPGLVFVMALYVIPLVFIVALAGLNNISSDLEDASNIAGAGTLATMIGVTLPLVMPALFAGLILASLEAMIIFSTPAMLAIPAGQHVMTTQIRAFMASDDYQVGLAAAFALPMLIAAICLIWMRRKALGRRGFATIGGKGGQRRPQRLGRYRWAVFGLCMVPLTCSLLLPALALGMTSLMKTYSAGFQWSNLTLDNYHFIFTNDAVSLSISNTLILGAMAATAGTILAGLIAYISQRRLVRGHQFMSFLATVPIAIPGIVLAIGLFAAYTREPIVLYGTLWILFIAYLTKYLPIAFQTSNAALMSIHPELEECARILGANRLAVFAEITIPLFKAGLIASWILIFMPSIRELSSSVLLWTTKTKVISVVILDFYEEGRLDIVSALGVLLMAITLVVVIVAYRIVGRDFMRT